MPYEQIKELKPEDCKRACGVHPQTFEKMLQVLQEHGQRKMKPGRPAKLALENQLLLTLQSWREYRPSFPIGLSWGIAESGVGRTVHRVANLLIKSHALHWPGTSTLSTGDTAFEVIMVDKKTAALLQREKEAPPPDSPTRCRARDARDHLGRCRQGTRARLQPVQAEPGRHRGRERVLSRAGLSRTQETASQQPHAAEEATRWGVDQAREAAEPSTL